MTHSTIMSKLAAVAVVAGTVAALGFHTPASAAAKFDAKGFFAQNCAACHGAKGQGGMGPNLSKVEAKGDKFIAERIKKGSSAKGMPPFESRLKGDELKALVAYVKSL
jgi:cytochrome c oxidase cbb3-type subunit 3